MIEEMYDNARRTGPAVEAHYQLINWLIPTVERFPKAQKFLLGDRIQATVVSTAGGLTLSRKLARGAATAAQLADAFQAGLPVEGKIEKVVKGGYEVRIAGTRAFCPMSQIDTIVRHHETG